jgi:tetratricopeptide (TPR) repeat protein
VLRWVGFFVAVIVVLNVLGHIPVVGDIFHGFLGFWLVAILLSIGAARFADWGMRRRRLANNMRALGHVDTAHNNGKLGVLYANARRSRKALPHLERAAEGEPEVAEWQYRRGTVLLDLRRAEEAVVSLERANAIDPEHAYGAVQLALADAHIQTGHAKAALESLDLFDRNHGPTPESAYWRGVALKKLGRGAEGRAILRSVGGLVQHTAKFHRKQQRAWIWRAWLASLV